MPSKKQVNTSDITAETADASLPHQRSPLLMYQELTEAINSSEFHQDFETVKPLLSHDECQSRLAARQVIHRLAIDKLDSRVSAIDKVAFSLCYDLSTRPLAGYATLDEPHVQNIKGLMTHINTYVSDNSQTRPLNFLMLASPGSGKSHFIECVAKQLS